MTKTETLTTAPVVWYKRSSLAAAIGAPFIQNCQGLFFAWIVYKYFPPEGAAMIVPAILATYFVVGGFQSAVSAVTFNQQGKMQTAAKIDAVARATAAEATPQPPAPDMNSAPYGDDLEQYDAPDDGGVPSE